MHIENAHNRPGFGTPSWYFLRTVTTPALASEDKVQQLLSLTFFADHSQWREAAEMLALALRLKPDCAEAREQLARVRRAQRQGQVPPAGATLRETAWEEFRRRALDGAHFLGLARLYEQKGEAGLAAECLDIAKAKAPSNPAPHKLHGNLLLQRGNAQAAARELTRAAHLDPFDRETAESSGLAEHKRQRYEPAATATARAFLLVGEVHSADAERLRRRLMTLKRILGWSTAQMAALERARDHLQTARERLEWHRERFLEEEGLPHGGAWFGATPARARPGLIALAARLRRMSALASLGDEQLFRMTTTVQEEMHASGSMVFAQRGDGRDLYLVEEGQVRLERTSGYGTFSLRSAIAGELAGEASWLLRQPRTTDAVASRPSRLLRIDGAALDHLCQESPDLSQQLLWCLWHSLAAKLLAPPTSSSVRSSPAPRCRTRRSPAACNRRPPASASTSPRTTRCACSANTACRARARHPGHLLERDALRRRSDLFPRATPGTCTSWSRAGC